MWQNFLKHLSVWAISFMIIFSTSVAYSQQCSFVYKDGERIERAIEVDGETFIYFPVDKATEMQKALEKFEAKGREISLLNKEVELLNKNILFKDGQIEMLHNDLQYSEDLALKALEIREEDGPFWEQPSVAYAGGIATAVLTFFLWEYARNVNQN